MYRTPQKRFTSKLRTLLELLLWAETRSTIELPALKIRVVRDIARHIPQRISLLHNRGWGVTSQPQATAELVREEGTALGRDADQVSYSKLLQ